MNRRGALAALVGAALAPLLKRLPVDGWRPFLTGRITPAGYGLMGHMNVVNGGWAPINGVRARYQYVDLPWKQYPEGSRVRPSEHT